MPNIWNWSRKRKTLSAQSRRRKYFPNLQFIPYIPPGTVTHIVRGSTNSNTLRKWHLAKTFVLTCYESSNLDNTFRLTTQHKSVSYLTPVSYTHLCYCVRYSAVPVVFHNLLINKILSLVSAWVEDFRIGRSADRGRLSVTREHLKLSLIHI